MHHYDLAVIGSGPAGQRAAIQAAKFGKRVAIIEAGELVGGACFATGTIPSKTIREAVLHLSGYHYRGIYGINYRVKEAITIADLRFRVDQVIRTEVEVARAQLSRNNIELRQGWASFLDAHRLRIDNADGAAEISADVIIIATGTRPAVSPRVPLNGRTIFGTDQILGIPALPRTLVVVGGGVVGVEYTSMFAALGVRCIVVEKRHDMLDFADREIVEALSYHLRENRVTLRFNEEVESVEEEPDGGVVANLHSKKIIRADGLLYAVGRQGNAEKLNLPAIGIEADARGRITVDECFRTASPAGHDHIYAVGDVIGFPSLASVSMEQGRLAALHAFSSTPPPPLGSYPYGIYTIPEISFIGKTEEQLTEEDVPYEVGVAYYREIARGQIRGFTDGRLKLIFHRDTRLLLGVHIIGEGASELLHIGQAVLHFGGTIDYFINTVFNYPTLAECYKAAAFNGLNRLGKTALDVAAHSQP